MILAEVIGTVVSTQKEASMQGLRFMLVQPVNLDGKATGASVVAVDSVGAGLGEMVMYCTGSSARQTQATNNRPCDAVIIGFLSWLLLTNATKAGVLCTGARRTG